MAESPDYSTTPVENLLYSNFNNIYERVYMEKEWFRNQCMRNYMFGFHITFARNIFRIVLFPLLFLKKYSWHISSSGCSMVM
jgi:hypothetical protein